MGEKLAAWLVGVLVAVGRELVPMWFKHQAMMHLALKEAEDDESRRVLDTLADLWRRMPDHPGGDPGPKPPP